MTEVYTELLQENSELEAKILRLEQENKELSFAIEKCLENAGIECDDEEQALRSLPILGNAHYKVLVEKEELEQENKELKEENIKVKKEFNNLIAEIISDIEYTGEITCNGESPKEHLHQMQKALASLEEIREIIRADCKRCTAECDCDNDCTRYKIKNKINEVLDE